MKPTKGQIKQAQKALTDVVNLLGSEKVSDVVIETNVVTEPLSTDGFSVTHFDTGWREIKIRYREDKK